MAEILPENTVESEIRDVYCIVPADETSVITVKGAVAGDDGEYVYDDVLYEGEGAPLLILCNGGGQGT